LIYHTKKVYAFGYCAHILGIMLNRVTNVHFLLFAFVMKPVTG